VRAGPKGQSTSQCSMSSHGIVKWMTPQHRVEPENIIILSQCTVVQTWLVLVHWAVWCSLSLEPQSLLVLLDIPAILTLSAQGSLPPDIPPRICRLMCWHFHIPQLLASLFRQRHILAIYDSHTHSGVFPCHWAQQSEHKDIELECSTSLCLRTHCVR
jgi:hypothetical protein